MKPGHVSVLVSYPDHFEIIEIPRELEAMQDLVDGFIELAPLPSWAVGGGWAAYCNEEGKLQGKAMNIVSSMYMDKLYVAAGALPFTGFDHLVGNVIWCDHLRDDIDSLPIEHIRAYTAEHLNVAYDRALYTPTITILRHHNHVWVFDQNKDEVIPDLVAACVLDARTGEHGTIEVWAGVSPASWTEVRVEIMDDFRIALHDERDDKSYG